MQSPTGAGQHGSTPAIESPRSGRNAVTVLSWCLLGAFGLALVLAFFVPMYTDEIGVKAALTRAPIDGWRPGALLPQCRSGYEQRLGLSLLPAAAFYYALLSRVGLLGLKISGFVIAVGCFLAAAWAVARTTTDRSARVRRLAIFVAPVSLGVVPLTLLMARAEPLLVFTVGAFLALPLACEAAAPASVPRRFALGAAFVLLSSVSIYSHPKMILFTPLMLLSVAMTFGVRRFPGWVLGLGAFVLANVAETHRVAKVIVQCEEVPEIGRILQSITLNPGLLRTAPGAFIGAGLKNLFQHPFDLADLMTFQLEYDARWLPGTHGAALSPFVAGVSLLARIAIVATVVVAPALVLTGLVITRGRQPRRVLLLAAVLLACVALHLFLSNPHYNFYNAAFVIPVFAIVDALSLWAIAEAVPKSWHARLEQPKVIAAIGAQGVALASLVVLFVHLGPAVLETARREGTIIPGQPVSVPVFGYSAEREKIRRHAASCGIAGDGSSRLVFDDATLFAFDHIREPIHLIYVTDAAGWGAIFRGEKVLALLHDLGSRGLITRCNLLPSALVDRVRRDGDYCCAGPDELR